MSGGGGKGGETVETIQIDPRLTEGAVQGLAAALDSASLPYTPNRGMTIASLAPQEIQAMNTMNDMGAAFGLPVADTEGYLPLPPNEINDLGMTGYSTGSLYDEQLDASVPQHIQDMRDRIIAGYANSANRVRGGGYFGGNVGLYSPMGTGGMMGVPYESRVPIYDEDGNETGEYTNVTKYRIPNHMNPLTGK